jgi:hypothetical protein
MNAKSATLLLSLAAAPVFAAPLQLDVYNPQEKGIFPVSSTLVSGPKKPCCLMRSSALKMARNW